jgi:hypothetical protein
VATNEGFWDVPERQARAFEEASEGCGEESDVSVTALKKHHGYLAVEEGGIARRKKELN